MFQNQNFLSSRLVPINGYIYQTYRRKYIGERMYFGLHLSNWFDNP